MSDETHIEKRERIFSARCKDCLFGVGYSPDWGESGLGECFRFYPPVETHEKNWCGEFVESDQRELDIP